MTIEYNILQKADIPGDSVVLHLRRRQLGIIFFIFPCSEL